jgi:hypothetical protein
LWVMYSGGRRAGRKVALLDRHFVAEGGRAKDRMEARDFAARTMMSLLGNRKSYSVCVLVTNKVPFRYVEA